MEEVEDRIARLQEHKKKLASLMDIDVNYLSSIEEIANSEVSRWKDGTLDVQPLPPLLEIGQASICVCLEILSLID